MQNKIVGFEDIISRQKSIELATQIFSIFKNLRNYSFKDQIELATISISNNIAEGYERSSNKEFCKFLYISKGSCAEVRSMLYVAKELNYIDQKTFEQLHSDCT